MGIVNTAICAYCDQPATFRIGNVDYELYACDKHEDVAYSKFDRLIGEDTWRMISMASHGFPINNKNGQKIEEEIDTCPATQL